MNKSQPNSESEFKHYYTIEELEKRKDEDLVFSTRVEIHKIIYFSVLKRCIPKIKFIAGDGTGNFILTKAMASFLQIFVRG
jgi:hypothetical protein